MRFIVGTLTIMKESRHLIRTLSAPIADAAHEIARIAYLDRTGGLIAIREHHGERHRLALSIRTLAREALERDAAGMVIVHNHPSGDATPSPDDLAFTRRLAETMADLGVRLHDHVVIAGDRGISFRRQGWL